GLRLVSLAQEACARRQCEAADRLAIVQYGKVATFLFKKQPFTARETAAVRQASEERGITVLYAPDDRFGATGDAIRAAGVPRERKWNTDPSDYARLILAPDRRAFYEGYNLDVHPTTDDRPFFFHTTRLRDQFEVAFGKTMLF